MIATYYAIMFALLGWLHYITFNQTLCEWLCCSLSSKLVALHLHYPQASHSWQLLCSSSTTWADYSECGPKVVWTCYCRLSHGTSAPSKSVALPSYFMLTLSELFHKSSALTFPTSLSASPSCLVANIVNPCQDSLDCKMLMPYPFPSRESMTSPQSYQTWTQNLNYPNQNPTGDFLNSWFSLLRKFLLDQILKLMSYGHGEM